MKTKEDIEKIAIKYSDNINMLGETSWSLADAFIAGYEYSDQQTKELQEQLAAKEKEIERLTKISRKKCEKCLGFGYLDYGTDKCDCPRCGGTGNA